MNEWYKIYVQEKTELKTVQQLSMLNIRTFVPFQEIIVGGKKLQQFQKNGIIYAFIGNEHYEIVEKLPFIKRITPCNIDSSNLPLEVL